MRALALGSASTALISRLSLSTISAGVRGAETERAAGLVAGHEIADRRQLRQQPERAAVVTASARTLPALDVRDRGLRGVEHELHLAADQVGHRVAGAAIRHMHHVHAGHELEQFAGHVDAGADAGRRKLSLPGLALA